MVTEWTGIKGSVAYVSLFKNEVLSLTCTYELPAIWSQFLFLVNACKKVKELSWSCLLSWISDHHFLIFVLMPVFLQTDFLLSSVFLVSWISCYVVYFLVFLCFQCSSFRPWKLDLYLSHCEIFLALKSSLLIFVSDNLFLYRFVPIPMVGLFSWDIVLGNAIFNSYLFSLD